VALMVLVVMALRQGTSQISHNLAVTSLAVQTFFASVVSYEAKKQKPVGYIFFHIP